MTESDTSTMPEVLPESAMQEERAHFFVWALAELGIAVEASGQQLIVSLPEADRAEFEGKAELRVAIREDAGAGQESLALDGRFGRWLLDRLQKAGPSLHARPRVQPMAVNEISAKLFAAYQVDGGQVHLAGCQLTDHPFLRLSFGLDHGDGSIRHVYVAPDGSPLGNDLVAKLGLDDPEPILRHPPRLGDAALRSLVAAGRRIAAKQSPADESTSPIVEPLATTVLWVRHAEGHLHFTIGKATAKLPFSGWARLLQPPGFVAQHSGKSTFHLAATDDGRIDAADEIAVCGESGRRVLRQELVECSVTGKQVLEEFTDVCSVSGRPALRSKFVTCTVCRQRVSSKVMVSGACEACRGMTAVSKDDPRMVWIFTEHPGLDRWKHWQLSETHSAYIAQAAGLWKRLLVVVDKETLAIHRLATADRVSKNWRDASGPAANDLLM